VAQRHVQAMREAPLHAVSLRFALLTATSAALAAEPATADTWFTEALRVPNADRWPFDHARLRLAHGVHLRRQHRIGPARASLAIALDTFLRLGARPWAAQAQHGLRATGMTVGRPVDAGAAQLTPAERTVAEMAAAGLTNKEIARRLTVSPHTVAARLHQVFPKLGIGSRAALRTALRESAEDGDRSAVSG
jgi:DNA-binding CsgD family transcriptional regulator